MCFAEDNGALLAPIDFIPVRNDESSVEVDFLSHAESQAVSETDFSLRNPSVWAIRPDGHSRMLDSWPVERSRHNSAVVAQ